MTLSSLLLKLHPRALSILGVTFHPHRQTELCQIMTRCGSDKGGWHNYTTLYHALLAGVRSRPLRIFELGLGTNNEDVPSSMGTNGTPGASLRGWREYFPNASIFGADIDRRILFQEDRIQTFHCDQTDPESIRALWANPALAPVMDIIVEDGLHTFPANKTFFENSVHQLSAGGLFIIEDLDEAARAEYEGQILAWQQIHRDLQFALLKIPSLIGVSNMLLLARKGEAGNPRRKGLTLPGGR